MFFLPNNITFTEVLDYLFIRSLSTPILLVLDEYSYLLDRTYIDSFLQSRMDQYKDNSQMKIILSGSYIDIMDQLLDINNPLHGRFKYKIRLEAFDYYEASNFYKNASLEDKIKYYAVFGGVPYYLSLINENKSFEENVKDLILSEYAPLENTTMKDEYSKIDKSIYLEEINQLKVANINNCRLVFF